jgi:hypothetical protein
MAKKLRLNQLKVKSFVTGLSRDAKNGINGGEYTVETECPYCYSLKYHSDCGTCITCDTYELNCTMVNCTVCCTIQTC